MSEGPTIPQYVVRIQHGPLRSRPAAAEYLGPSFWAFYFVLAVFLVSLGSLSWRKSETSWELHSEVVLCGVADLWFNKERSFLKLESGWTVFYIFITFQGTSLHRFFWWSPSYTLLWLGGLCSRNPGFTGFTGWPILCRSACELFNFWGFVHR